jgi:excisionase family DNA binding protein
MKDNSTAKLLSFSEAAKELNIGRDALLNLIKNGKIGFIVLGLRKKIAQSELLRFIESETLHLVPDLTSTISAKVDYSNNISLSFNSIDYFNEITGRG